MESGTTALRKAAPEWNLAGDKNLLQVLEDIHQKLMSKCQEVNTKLDDMVNKLDNASVDLQNVNNKFLALSNSQFIESRVYDEDVTLEEEHEKKTSAPVTEEDELLRVKHSLQTFEQMHEAVRILDSDSSDDEDDFSTILKPKDMYSDRPLPYIIGSQQWKTRWHVGLAPSESESDSDSDDLFKRSEPQEQYSETESEEEGTYQREAAREVSSSSDVESEPTPGPSGAARPADIAAQIARRLAAQQPPLETLEKSRESSVSDSGPRKVYRVEQPGAVPVFSEEPPPLDNSIDDYSDNYSDEDDIFAELHRKPANHRQSNTNSFDPIVEKLFGDEVKGYERKQEEKVINTVDSPILTEKNSNKNLLPEQEREPAAKSNDESRKQTTIKKPVSGVSLFGSSQAAESIGAAILKRNQRKSSTSDEDDKAVKENTQPHQKVNSVPTSTNKIIEDLFTKPKSSLKESIADRVPDNVASTAQKITLKPKIDLFSDNIFDDVDDIFTSEIITKPKKTNHKSIFDDDDLFSEVPTKTITKENKKNTLFDSDDELFKENLNESVSNDNKEPVKAKIDKSSKMKNTETSIFSDDNDSDDIFASNNNTPKNDQSQETPNISNYIPIQRNNDNIHSANNIDNMDSEELNKNQPKMKHTQIASTLNPILQPKNLESPSLFDDEDIDDLLTTNMKTKEEEITTNIKTNDMEQLFDDESVTKVTKDSIKNNDKSSEQQVTKTTDLVVNNTESDEYLFTLPTSRIVEENNTNTPNSMEKISNDLNYNTKDDKNFVTDLAKVQDTKNVSLSPEKSNNEIETLQPVTVPNNSSPDFSITDENTNNPDTTTESCASSIKHDLKQHAQLDDLFSDVPPAFEKPSEPKKSKNVNALFDDDSDDEALFFRKSDVSDEKPKSYNDDRFSIFHDEPPDVDVDFTTKTDNFLKNEESDEDLFNLPKSSSSSIRTKNAIDNKPKSVEFYDESIDPDDFLFSKTQDLENKEKKDLDISNLLNSENIETESKFNSEKTSSVQKQTSTITSEQQSKDLETSTKKIIGKLKPMNININVHSLLPGASPTKQQTKDESDGTAFSTQSNEELNKYSSEIKNESQMVKSVSFDSNAESEILDNKLSKERARIQVKRRPSSRRARLEAARKSVIDITDDSTDNSSSFDEPKPVSSDHERISKIKVAPVQTNTSDIVSSKTENTVVASDISSNKSNDNVENITTEIKSKTVYILHDEDIFSNSPNTKTDNPKKTLTILDDDDEHLFKDPSSTFAKNNETLENPKDLKKDINKKNAKNNKGLGNTPTIKATKSIFDDLSDDDELFLGKKGSESSSINVKEKKSNKVKQNMPSIKTVSLFGDDSDDDDLFKTTNRTEVKVTKPKEMVTVKSTAVKDDPLSLFDDS